MFRLIKLAMYAVVGYVLYELYQGMMQQQPQGGRAFGGGGSSSGGASFDEEGGRGMLTGGGTGMTDTTTDGSGIKIRHTVGRGVIR